MLIFGKENPIQALLVRINTIAVVGLSDNPNRASYRIASYLQDNGYRIIPVNPNISDVMGENAYPDLKSVPVPIDIVVVFRQKEEVLAVIEEALEQKIPAVWLQAGLYSQEGERLCLQQGVSFVQNRCIMQEHRRWLP